MNNLSIRYDQERFSNEENQLIEDALEFSEGAHAGQLRASGEPYIVHPMAVAEIVAGWGLDYEAICAALLHDVVEDTRTALAEISERFGPKVAELVDGLTKLRMSSSPRPALTSARRDISNENLRKLLLATSKDTRVIMIKLADRLHNMRTLAHLSVEQRHRIAVECLEIYGPVADRLGMGQLKGELEDLGFKYSMPEQYSELVAQVKTSATKGQRYLAKLKHVLATHLKDGGVEVVRIEGRQKHFYSIHKKMVKVDGDIEKIYDLIAVRVIVPDVAACYQALGIIHQYYRPLIYRIKDYIAVPKTNGYQSLHTTVFAEEGKITEIQIRTQLMHEAAEYGLAAHFFYDMQKPTAAYAAGSSVPVPRSYKWVNKLAQLQQTAASGQEFVEDARLELFSDRIFVFSPKGDLYDLPDKATALDFAFAVHSQIGLSAMGAKVNGRMVPLYTRLDNRDVVEIVTRRQPAPSRDWVSFVATSHAKSRLRSWFRAQSRDANLSSGRSLLEAQLQTWGVKKVDDLPKRAVADLIDGLHMKNLNDVFVGVGDGSLSPDTVIRRLIPNAAKPKDAKVVRRAEPTGRVMVEGDDRLPYALAACCKPVYPVALEGYITRGKGVTVHAKGCPNIPPEPERIIRCRWETEAGALDQVICRLEVQALDRIGLFSDVAYVVSWRKLRMVDVTSAAAGTVGQVTIKFGVEVGDLFVLADLMRHLERVTSVTRVSRVDARN